MRSAETSLVLGAEASERAVGQASAVVLLVLLVGLVVVCVALLLVLRRRSRPGRGMGGSGGEGVTDAWVESARRVALEDDEEIPREPGSG